MQFTTGENPFPVFCFGLLVDWLKNLVNFSGKKKNKNEEIKGKTCFLLRQRRHSIPSLTLILAWFQSFPLFSSASGSLCPPLNNLQFFRSASWKQNINWKRCSPISLTAASSIFISWPPSPGQSVLVQPYLSDLVPMLWAKFSSERRLRSDVTGNAIFIPANWMEVPRILDNIASKWNSLLWMK